MAPPSLGGSGALAVIAAVARNGVIGANNALPWRLPADLARFREITTGHAVIMGRRTWDSLPRPLPGRQNIVVTRSADFAAEGTEIAHSLDDALARVCLPEPAFCIGGADLYRLALPRADVLYITEIDRDFAGDTRFPDFDRTQWRVTSREAGLAPDGFEYAFVTYRRQ
jgi:dihydrofolate reductase